MSKATITTWLHKYLFVVIRETPTCRQGILRHEESGKDPLEEIPSLLSPE